MAQNKVSVNLSAADFTLSHSFKGRSVVIPGQDQNFFGSTGAWAGASPQKGVDIPQVYYCENIVPTAEGYRSVAYRYSIPAPAVPAEFVRIFNVFDGQANSALIGITKDLRLYVVSSYTGALWVPLALPDGYSWSTPSLVTTTTVIGFIGICIQGVGWFSLDATTSTLIPQTPIGLDPTEITGICASNSILIAWDNTTVYWSSALAPLDFTPSLTTGAGSATPEGLKGSIILCKEIKGGFVVYSEVTIIGAQYTQNNAIPWIFDVLGGGAGVNKAEAVAYDINLFAHFAWTSAGLMSIEITKAELLFPQVTDFIASGLSDATADFVSYPNSEFSSASKEVRLAVVSSRYLCISFGHLIVGEPDEFPVPVLKQSFLYDAQLKRWGKLNAQHIQMVEAPFTADAPVFF